MKLVVSLIWYLVACLCLVWGWGGLLGILFCCLIWCLLLFCCLGFLGGYNWLFGLLVLLLSVVVCCCLLIYSWLLVAWVWWLFVLLSVEFCWCIVVALCFIWYGVYLGWFDCLKLALLRSFMFALVFGWFTLDNLANILRLLLLHGVEGWLVVADCLFWYFEVCYL